MKKYSTKEFAINKELCFLKLVNKIFKIINIKKKGTKKMKKILLSLLLIGCINYVFANDQMSSKNEKNDLVTFGVDTGIVKFRYTGSPDVMFRLDGPKDIKPIGNAAAKVFFFEIDKSKLDSTYLEVQMLKNVGAPKVLKKVSLGELLANPNHFFEIKTEVSGQAYTSKYTILIDTREKELFGKSVVEFAIHVDEESPLVHRWERWEI